MIRIWDIDNSRQTKRWDPGFSNWPLNLPKRDIFSQI